MSGILGSIPPGAQHPVSTYAGWSPEGVVPVVISTPLSYRVASGALAIHIRRTFAEGLGAKRSNPLTRFKNFCSANLVQHSDLLTKLAGVDSLLEIPSVLAMQDLDGSATEALVDALYMKERCRSGFPDMETARRLRYSGLERALGYSEKTADSTDFDSVIKGITLSDRDVDGDFLESMLVASARVFTDADRFELLLSLRDQLSNNRVMHNTRPNKQILSAMKYLVVDLEDRTEEYRAKLVGNVERQVMIESAIREFCTYPDDTSARCSGSQPFDLEHGIARFRLTGDEAAMAIAEVLARAKHGYVDRNIFDYAVEQRIACLRARFELGVQVLGRNVLDFRF